MCCGNAWKPIYFSKKDDGTTQSTTENKKEITTSSTTESIQEYQNLQQSHINQNFKSTTTTTTTRKSTTATTGATLKYTEELTQSGDFSHPSYSNVAKEESDIDATTIVPFHKPTEDLVLTNASYEEILPGYTFYGTENSQKEQEVVFPTYGHYSYSDNYYYNFYDEIQEPLKTIQIESIESLNNFEMYGKKTTKTITTTSTSTTKVQRL